MEKVLLANLDGFAKNILEAIKRSPRSTRAFVLVLSGDLGAGKTTFTQALGRELGVAEIIQSPTYVLMKSYPINFHDFKTLIHIDAYRLEGPEEFKTLRPDEFLNDPRNLVVCEWPEKLGNLLPKPDLILKFSSEEAQEGERFIEVE